MKANEALREIERGTHRPVYVLFGPEDGLRDRIICSLIDRLVAPGWQDMNVVHADGDHLDLLVLARTPVFGGGRRVVVVKDSGLLGGGRRESEAEAFARAFLNYLAEPGPDTCLVLACPVERPSQRSRPYRALSEAGALVECAPLSLSEAIAWAVDRARQRGKLLGREAAAYIAEGASRRLVEIESEVDKLVLYVGDEPRIGVEDVRAAGAARSAGIFDLTDAVAAGDIGPAVRTLHGLLRQGEPPVMILFMLARQYRLLWKAGRLLATGVRPAEIAHKLRLPQSVTRRLLSAAAGYDQRRMVSAFSVLLDADVAIKLGQLDPTQAVELAVLKLARLGS